MRILSSEGNGSNSGTTMEKFIGAEKEYEQSTSI